MELIRTFHPVGQGGFYSEKFYENNNMVFSVIYDCGSFSLDTLKNEIDTTFKNSNYKINILFISHFHQDHINGVKYLIKECKVDYIFIPEIDEDEKILILSSYSIENREENSFIYKFLIDSQQAIKELNKYTKVIFIKPLSKKNLKEKNLEFNNQNIIFPNLEKEKIFINSDTKLIFKYNDKPIWKYIFNNFKDNKLSAKINEFKKKYSINLPLNSEIYNTFIKKDEYKKLFINKNIYSLILYSAPIDKNSYFNKSTIHYDMYEIFFSEKEYLHKTGCLYTGDFNLNNTFNFIEDILHKNKISLFQIPHHGSKNSWNNKHKKYLKNKFLFISAGKKNIYSHPNKEVLIDILSTYCCYLRVICEDKESKIEMKINIF